MLSSVCLVLASSTSSLAAPSTGELTCQVVASADPSLLDRWNLVPSEQFEVPAARSVVRGQLFTFYVFFEDFGTNEDGVADLSYGVRITRPDGEVYFETEGEDFTGWRRAVADPDDVLLAESLVHCFFEPGDQLGTYTAHVTATDAVTGATAEATTEVELREYEEGAAFDDLDEVQTWIAGYANDPDPERIVPAFRVHCANAGFRPEVDDQRTDGFLLEALETNPWLFAELFDGFEKRTPDEKHGVLWLLAHSSSDPEPFVKKLSSKDRNLWKEVSADALDPMNAPLRERHDINELYGRWQAARRFAHLERLILALHEDGGVCTDETVYDEKSGVDVPLHLVIAMTIAKLLSGLFPADPVARAYATTLAESGTLPPGVTAELEELLSP